MPESDTPDAVMYVVEPEGATRCNECGDWVDDRDAHALTVHGTSEHWTVVHDD